MAAMFPNAEFVGVDLEQNNIDLACRIQAARGLSNFRFLVSRSE
jgi:tRNA G46 methylase TrmB